MISVYIKNPNPMKKDTLSLTMLYSLVILLSSFVVSNNALGIPKSTIDKDKEGPVICFIQLNDGTIKHYNSLKLVTGILKTPHLLADNSIIINSKDIIAYQNDKHYAVSSKKLISSKSGLIASETLPGFAILIVNGKLNVYCRKYYNGSTAVDEYFIQNGQEGPIIAYSKDLLKNMLKEDAKALEYFSSATKESTKSKRLLQTVEMYNSTQLMTKN